MSPPMISRLRGRTYSRQLDTQLVKVLGELGAKPRAAQLANEAATFISAGAEVEDRRDPEV